MSGHHRWPACRLFAIAVGLTLFVPRTVAAEVEAPGVAGAPAASKKAAQTVDELHAQLEAYVTQPRFSPALWGVKVISLETGRTLFEHHADRLLSPASNAKLYVGALALDQLGPGYRITTPIFATAAPNADGVIHGDLIIAGRGDPSWNSGKDRKNFAGIFEPFTAVLRRAGIRRVTGDVIADATYFSGRPNGAGWTADDLNDYYGAEISAVTLEDNYASLRLVTGGRAGEPCSMTWLQPHSELTIDNRTQTAPAGTPRHIEAIRLYGETVVHLFGSLPLGGKEEIVDVTIPRPADWFARALKAAVAEQGILIEGGARGVRWPDRSVVGGNAIKLGEITSPPVRELVGAFMKPSQNLQTDLLFGHIGELQRTADTPVLRTTEEWGVIALRNFLRRAKLPVDEVRFEEGSGLSRNDLTTANATVRLLQFMSTHAAAADFYAALPVAGVDGTLAKRMKGTPAEKNLRGKTGTLRYAHSLAGDVVSAGGERLAFCFMLNRYVETASRTAGAELDALALMLARFAGRTTSEPARGPGSPAIGGSP